MQTEVTVDRVNLKIVSPPRWLPAEQHEDWKQAVLRRPLANYAATVAIMRALQAKKEEGR